MAKKPLMLIIMDGYGLSDEESGNAIKAADTPNLDRISKDFPSAYLNASGLDVGLPDGQMGNSEVGHTNIGAGRVVYQELTRITKSIQDGDFYENEELAGAVRNAKANNGALHIMGLISPGGVHSHAEHLYAILRLAKKSGLSKVFVHAFLDGRDVPPASGAGYVADLQDNMAKIGVGKIASVMGRYYAMDRDNRWERVKLAYDAIIGGKGAVRDDAVEGIRLSYEDNKTDEFVVPFTVKGTQPVNEGDSLIFFNFRPDRAREITRSIVDKEFSGFVREKVCQKIYFVCMTQYDATIKNVYVAYKPQSLENTFGEYISKMGLRQLRIAETEKYAHVTFFFNGGVEEVYEGEDRCLIPSPKVATYDLKPEMSAYEVRDAVLERVAQGIYDVIVLNFANCDMVGHTGIFDAAKSAVETVDECVGEIVDKVESVGGACIIIADHGNSERMIDSDGITPFTAHTINKVPFIVTDKSLKVSSGRLADVAPTMLDMLGLNIPGQMQGQSLIKRV